MTTPPNVFTRNKRRRDDDLAGEFTDFKEEIKQMIASFTAAQTQELQKITPVLRDIQQSNQNIEQSVVALTAQNEEFRKKIHELENQVQEDKKHIALLEDKLEEVQRNNRKTNFEIKNVPKKPTETREDLIDMVTCLSNTVGCSLNKQDIRDIYRVRGKKENTNSPIVVETNSTQVKMDVLKMSKAYNIKNKTRLCAKHLGHRESVDTPVFISEQLTAKGSRLHFLARDLVKSKEYKFCWTSFGKVYIRKDENSPIILIQNEAQVHQLMQTT